MHFHTIGNRCWCGYLTVPVRFHERDSRGNVIGNKGPERYLAWLASDEKPAHVNPPVMEEVLRNQAPVTKVRDESPNNVTTCDETPKKGRPAKYKNRAEQQAAYRRRHA